MNRSRSSNAWLREHVSDSYVQRAKAEGYRSRAAYKLLEIDEGSSDPPGDVVVDLGASSGWLVAGGGQENAGRGRSSRSICWRWSQLPGVVFLQGDFREQDVWNACKTCSLAQRVGLVLSDMSPNISGIALCDQARACIWPNWLSISRAPG
jgi:23S rRNA (uridine2552-2'-O)-methyltransferase